MWFENRTGMRIAADTWGDPADPAVILIHGGGQTRHSWGGTAEALAEQGWYAVAYDQRGHGVTDRAPDRDYGNERFATDVLDVANAVEELSGVPPVLVGASLGGLASLLAEGDLSPGVCSALVLVDITPRMEPDGVRRIVGFMLDKVHEGFGVTRRSRSCHRRIPTTPSLHRRTCGDFRRTCGATPTADGGGTGTPTSSSAPTRWAPASPILASRRRHDPSESRLCSSAGA